MTGKPKFNLELECVFTYFRSFTFYWGQFVLTAAEAAFSQEIVSQIYLLMSLKFLHEHYVSDQLVCMRQEPLFSVREYRLANQDLDKVLHLGKIPSMSFLH
jgi:hypothetical protein